MLVAVVTGIWMFGAGLIIGSGIGNGRYLEDVREYGTSLVLVEVALALVWPITVPLSQVMAGLSKDEQIEIERIFLVATGLEDACLVRKNDGTAIHCFKDAIPEEGEHCNCGQAIYRADGYCALVSYSEEA